jgi:SAM-dependent methyltransferase
MLECPLCKGKDLKLIYDFSTQEFQEFPLPGKVFRCKKCGFLYKEFVKSLNEVYDDEYAKEYLALEEYHSGVKTREFFKKVLRNSGKVAEGKRLLDVGCGVGTALEVARELGFEAEGVELNQELSKIVREKGFIVYNDFIENLSFESKYDIILMMDLIEHLTAPLDVLNSLKNNLTDDGIIIIYTPNHSSLIVTLFKMLYLLGYKKPAALTFASNHISFFDVNSIKVAALNCGMKINYQFFEVFKSQRMGGRTNPLVGNIISMVDRFGLILGKRPFRMVCYLGK